MLPTPTPAHAPSASTPSTSSPSASGPPAAGGPAPQGLAPGALEVARVLVVDDEPVNVLLLQRILEGAGFTTIEGLLDPRQVAQACEQRPPDIVLLDLMMPHMDGFAVMEHLRGLPGSEFLPILVLTADSLPATRQRALSQGAQDFLLKPFDPTEVLQRVRNLLQTRALQLALQREAHTLEQRVRERTRELEEAQAEVLRRLAQAAEFRDDDTGQHTRRVADLAARLAHALGLGPERCKLIHRAAPLHDVGKIGVSDTILLKPSKLTPEEFEVMKGHTTIGAAILADGASDLVKTAQSIALTHHEKWDGTGYPRGLSGEAIPIEGRILAAVDVFDALTNERPYKRAWPIEDALAEIERLAGHHFDPTVAAAMARLVRAELASQFPPASPDAPTPST